MKTKNDFMLKSSLENDSKLNDLFENGEKLNMNELLKTQGGNDEDLDEDCYVLGCIELSCLISS